MIPYPSVPSDFETQSKLNRFQGAAAISSNDYFDRDGSGGGGGGGGGSSMARGPSGDMDLTAADLVNRLSFQAKQDLDSMKQLAGSVGQTLTGMASKFMSDIGRGY
jgi:ADP-ribosylation factor GTPase-activating protein 2/3